MIFSNPEEQEWPIIETQGEIIREELAALRNQFAQTEALFSWIFPAFEQNCMLMV